MRAAVLAIALSLAACAQPGSLEGAAPTSLELLGRLPPRIEMATLARSPERDPAPGAVEGAFARYQMPFGSATIYLFRSEAAPVPAGPDSAQVRQHLHGATEALTLVGALRAAGEARRGTVAWERRPDFGVRGPEGYEFRCTETWRVSSDPGGPQPQAEYICVTGMYDRILKLRVTIRDPGKAADSARSLVGALAMRAASALAPVARS